MKGTDFLLEGGEGSLRLAYSAVPPDQIEEGIARMAEAYRELSPHRLRERARAPARRRAR